MLNDLLTFSLTNKENPNRIMSNDDYMDLDSMINRIDDDGELQQKPMDVEAIPMHLPSSSESETKEIDLTKNEIILKALSDQLLKDENSIDLLSYLMQIALVIGQSNDVTGKKISLTMKSNLFAEAAESLRIIHDHVLQIIKQKDIIITFGPETKELFMYGFNGDMETNRINGLSEGFANKLKPHCDRTAKVSNIHCLSLHTFNE